MIAVAGLPRMTFMSPGSLAGGFVRVSGATYRESSPLHPNTRNIYMRHIIVKRAIWEGRGQCSRAERAMQVLDLLNWVQTPTGDAELWSWRRSLAVMTLVSLALWGLVILAIAAAF